MRVIDLEQHLLDVAARNPQHYKVAETYEDTQLKAASKELIVDEETTASGCYHAVHHLCGEGVRAWEPESIWLTLDRQNIDIPVINRDKVLASFTLTTLPSFWFDVCVFENTVVAFNNELSDGTRLQEASPAQIAWAVYEASLLYSSALESESPPPFDREPTEYTAIVLNRAGFIKAPDMLQYAQESLNRYNKLGTELTVKDVTSKWNALKKENLEDYAFTESPLDAQLQRLSEVEAYFNEMLSRYKQDLAALRLG